MRALRLDDQLHFSHTEPEPQPEPGEALIGLRLAGICHTDLEITHGYKGFNGILGHEFVGELLADAGAWQAGQRVIGEINIACGQCDFCQRGISSQCRNRRALGITHYPGVFADQFRLPLRNLYPVPDDIPDRAAVLTEPLAAALQVTALVQIHPGDRVVLVGAGKLGLLIAQVLKLTGCDLAVVARQPRPLALLEQWGIPAVDARAADPLAALGRAQADVVVDATGSSEGFALALNLVKPRGTIVLKSTYAGLPQADLSRLVVDEIKVVGSRCGPFPAALRLMQSGLVDLDSMIDCIYPLDDALTAFEYAAGRGILKVLLSRSS